MLSNYEVITCLPTGDVSKSKSFYQEKLGLKVLKESEGDLLVEAAGGTKIYLYKRGPSLADHTHTQASFSVPDIYKEVEELTSKGVAFEQYDFPEGIKTDEKGVAKMGDEYAAWFKDPDGNILGLNQK